MKPFRNLLLLSMICLSTNHFVNAQSKIDSIEIQKSYYHSAMNEIKDMLDGKTPLSYEKAIFLMENAYNENKLSYSEFQNIIDFYVDKIQFLAKVGGKKFEFSKSILETEESQLVNYNNAYLNYSIFSFMTDTTYILGHSDTVDQILYFKKHLPYQYSVVDPFGTKDWKNSQVNNLLRTNTGNCFAFSSLFKIFADRLNTGANICTAPGHIYIRHANDKGVFFNVELATASFPGTGSLKMLTYTTNEALKNDLSLRELDLKQSVVLSLIYLAKGYEYKFGVKNDELILQLAELALQYDSYSLNAMLLKANFLEGEILNKQMNITNVKRAPKFKEYEELITKLYNLGYREMPLEMKNLIVSELRNDSVAFVVKNHTPQPYKSIGVKDNRYASLSWGMFEEIHETKPFEQYNRTIFDTKNKKISGFAKQDDLYIDYNFDPVVFALSIDPYTRDYPQLTPYQFASNTPIWAIDMDGLEAWVATRKWEPADIGKYSEFVKTKSAEYKSQNIKFDCADLAFELLIDYASTNGLPLSLKTEASEITNTDNSFIPNPSKPNNKVPIAKGDIKAFKELVKNYSGVNALEKNTYTEDRKNAVAGDMYLMGQLGDLWHAAILINPANYKSKDALVQGNIPEVTPEFKQDWIMMQFSGENSSAAGDPAKKVSRFIVFEGLQEQALKDAVKAINEAGGLKEAEPGKFVPAETGDSTGGEH